MNTIDRRFLLGLRRLLRREPRFRRLDFKTRAGLWGESAKRMLVLVIGAGIIGAAPAIRDFPLPRLASTVVLWLALGIVAGALRQSLERDPHLFVLALLPVSDREVFARQFRKGIVGSWKTFVAVALGFGWATWKSTDSVPNALLSAAAFACVFPPLAVAIAVASLRWRAIALWLHSTFFVAIAAGLLGNVFPSVRHGIAALLQRHGDAIAATFPTGWLVLPWHAWTSDGPHLLYLAALPLPVVLATIPALVSWLRESYRVRDSVLLSAFGEVPEGAPPEFAEAVANASAAPRSRGETTIVDDLLARRFLADQLPAPTAWIERWVWRWWTPRQRLCAGFLSSDWPRWSRHFLVSLGLATTALGIGWAIRTTIRIEVWSEAWLPVWLAGGAVSALIGLPFQSGFGRGFKGIPQGNQVLSPFLWQPLAFGELTFVLLKPNLVRTLVMLPACVGFGMIVAWILEFPPWTGATIALQISLVPLAVFPWTLTAGFRSGLSTYRRSLAAWIAGGIYVLACVANLAGLVGVFFPLVGLAVLPAMALLNLGQLALLRRLLRTGKLDALRPPGGQRTVTTL